MVMDVIQRRLTDLGFDSNDIWLIFSALNANGNGYLEFSEFKQALSDLKMELSDESASAIFRIFDKQNPGRISFRQFAEGFKGRNVFSAGLIFRAMNGLQLKSSIGIDDF